MNTKTRVRLLALACVPLGLAGLPARPAWAGQADDLQRMIERERRGLEDLRRLDQLKAASEDIALIGSWLDEAWNLRGREEYERASETLERVDAQKDMVREKITASQHKAEAAKLEERIEQARARVKELQRELRELSKKKTALGSDKEKTP